MSDIIGPANAANAVTVRPAETRSFLSLDTWFKDCSGPLADDGTSVEASWLNGMLAWSRAIWRGNGNRLDGITPVVPEVGTDDSGPLKAIQQLIQRGQILYADDSSSTPNVLVASLSPALVEYKKGLTVAIGAATTNTGATTLSLNGLPTKDVVRPDGSNLLDSDIIAGSLSTFRYDGTKFQLVGAASRPTLARNLHIYVNGAIGNDANDGTANVAGKALATIQAAINLAYSYAPSQYSTTIHVATGTYAPFATPPVQGPVVIVVGDTSNASNVVIQSNSTLVHCVQVSGPTSVSVSYVKVVNTGGAQAGGFVATGAGATLSTSNTVSGLISTGAVFEAYGGASVTIAGPHTYQGNCVYMMWGMYGGRVSVAPSPTASMTVSTPITVTYAVLAAMAGQVSVEPPNMLWTGYANVTGTKFLAATNGIINVNAAGVNYFPGTVAGTTNLQGLYV